MNTTDNHSIQPRQMHISIVVTLAMLAMLFAAAAQPGGVDTKLKGPTPKDRLTHVAHEAHDATENSPPARMRIAVADMIHEKEDRTAVHPITMDPLFSQQQKLTASDGAAFDLFGRSVAISGDTAVVGAFQDDDAGNNSGAAYVFVRSGNTWTQQQKLTAFDAAANDLFGWSAAISGDTIVVGSYRDEFDGVPGSFAGSAHVFVRTGTTWT